MIRWITPNALFLAILLSAPAMWSAITMQGSAEHAIFVYLAAVGFSSVGLGLLKVMTDSYRRGTGRPGRRAGDTIVQEALR